MKNLTPNFILQKDLAKQSNGGFSAATMFIDIKGFTPIAEKLLKKRKIGAETLSVILESVFRPVIALIYSHGGFISEFAGDGINAVFPDDQATPSMALNCAIQIKNDIASNRIHHTEFGDFNTSLKKVDILLFISSIKDFF